ncbi:N-fatty-acyl-amino acid synthase/hydrolase PM20D1.2-like isoform X2 [Dreissena polymorpha]|uniref:N-fatty-acyl-amino acid synthase/hydrolase PM20D1.2-like isoform X2 n=1 Tax=Dreissena polymorpha TaxID=45954 RepID=UPI0022652704|nr:N-fatty-acyl-amino acid synthase/hydrolase PM20D1.2-like isoform X2 [Dreissena polymorpha]
MTLFKKVCLVLSIILFSIITIVIIRTLTINTRDLAVSECSPSDLDFIEVGLESKALQRFRDALRIQTVSRQPHDYNRNELAQLVQFIISAYPELHASPLIEYETVANLSLLYTVRGSNKQLRPYLLMAHLDVVPAEPGNWDTDPFSAEIKDGFIYGRGSIDFKHGVMGILEALNFYVSLGKQPERGFYVAFGHDEEVSGLDGAKAISDALWERGVHKLEFLLDEGLTVTNQIIQGLKEQTALIGVSEKGYLHLELKVVGEPGHSSMPPPESTIGILATAVSRLERNPLPSMLGYGPERDMFEHLAPHLPFKMVMANLWLFKPVVSWLMSKKPVTNAIIRTVTAVTMFQAGIKLNVNAPEATAYVNHRIHPAQSVAEVIEYDRRIINDDRVKIRVVSSMEPHSISPSGEEDFGYQTVKNSIRQIWNRTLVAPGTMIGNTDTHHYLRMSSNVYRFSPTVMYPGDTQRFHGDNERISVKNYEQAVNFYYHVMVNANKGKINLSHSHGEL